eukprot:SAG22_NODE_12252_length_450_cov_0.752137_2_plen_61_part_00
MTRGRALPPLLPVVLCWMSACGHVLMQLPVQFLVTRTRFHFLSLVLLLGLIVCRFKVRSA